MGTRTAQCPLGCLPHSLSFAASPRPLPRLTTTCRSIGLIADDLHKSDKTNADVLLITRPLDVSVVLMGSVSTAGEILVEGKIRRFGDERHDGRRSGSTCNRRSRLISLSISSLSYHHGTPPSVKQLWCVLQRDEIQIPPARIYGSDSIESSCNGNQPFNKGYGDLNVSKRIQNYSCYSVGLILKPVALQGICVGSVRRCSLISCRPQLIAGDRVNPLRSPITRASPASREDGPILQSLPLIQVNALKDKGLSLRSVEESLTFDSNTLDTKRFKL